MFTLSFNGFRVGVLQGDHHLYEFNSEAEARQAVLQSEEVNVIFQPGNRNMTMTTASVKERLKIEFPTSAGI
jgi:hypothetical protein